MSSNFPNGFAGGVLIRGVPVDIPHPGEVFWVNGSGATVADAVIAKGSKSPSDGNKGTYREPFRTIDYAIGKCTASRGDVIYVMPGTVEALTAADDIDLDVAGVSIIGLGSGALRPRVDFTGASGSFKVDASNCTVHNINFHANVPTVTFGINIAATADWCTFSNCLIDTETEGTDEFTRAFNVNACTGLTIEDCVFDAGLGGAAQSAIKMVGAIDRTTIRRCRIVGDYSVANINHITTAATELYIEDNLLVNGGSGNINAQPVIEVLTNSTGVVRRNTFFCNVADIASQTVADAMIFSENYAGEDAGAAAGNILRTVATSVTGSADDA